MNLAIQCRCGSLEGIAHDVSPRAGNHLVCYCDDCQAFQHELGQAETVLDSHGGTRIYQMSPGRFEITKGQDKLACLQLSPNGVARWYAGCCRTPLGNTLATQKLLFVGVIAACLETANDSAVLDKALGPVLCGVHGRFAKGVPADVNVHDTAPLSLIVRFFSRMLLWKLRGDAKRSPFHDPTSGALVVTPVLAEKR